MRLGTPLRFYAMLGIGTALVYLAWLPPGIYSVDGNSMLAVSESLVTHHSFAVPPGDGIVGRHGVFYSSWYPLLSLLGVPFVAIATVAARFVHLPLHYLAAVCALALQALLTGGTVSFVAALAVLLGADKSGARLAALSFGFGTIALAYARTFYAEPLLAFITASGLYFALKGTDEGRMKASALSGLAVLAKPTGVILGPIFASNLLLKGSRLRTWAGPLIATASGLGLYALYNEWRFGSALNFGPPLSFRISALPAGLSGLLLSPGGGLLWFCPPVIAATAGLRTSFKSRPLETLSIAAVFLAYLFFYSFWTYWYGGWSWGPRFLLPALPGLMACSSVLRNRWKRALVVLTVVGFLVKAPTLLSFYERFLAEAAERDIDVRALLWSPSQAPILHAWPAAYRQEEDARQTDPKVLFVDLGAGPSHRIASSRALRVVAVWWWLLPGIGVPRWIGLAVSLSLMGLGAWLIVTSTHFAPSPAEPIKATSLAQPKSQASIS